MPLVMKKAWIAFVPINHDTVFNPPIVVWLAIFWVPDGPIPWSAIWPLPVFSAFMLMSSYPNAYPLLFHQEVLDCQVTHWGKVAPFTPGKLICLIVVVACLLVPYNYKVLPHPTRIYPIPSQSHPIYSTTVLHPSVDGLFQLCTCKTSLHPPRSFVHYSICSICPQTVSNRQSNCSCKYRCSLLQALLYILYGQ